MKIIAHRGGIGKGMQNSPDGVRLAVRCGADFVELDVLEGIDGTFHCAHGLGGKSKLADCLMELGESMGFIAHLKGRYEDADLLQVVDAIAGYISLTRVIFASHDSRVLGRLRETVPEARLARFGLFPAITALWKRQPWECCMINHLVLLKCHVAVLQKRGYRVFASCVWEFRSRPSVKRLGVDGAFVNLR